MSSKQILVPDVGGAAVEVIEILVKVGDNIKLDDPIITLESDKATMDVPASVAGVVEAINVKVGAKINEGDVILTVKAQGDEKSAPPKAAPAPAPKTEAVAQKSQPTERDIVVPDVGGASHVDVIEVLVKVGDQIKADDPIVTLESDKATMDVPAPFGGKVQAIKVKAGSKVSEGDLLITVLADAGVTPATKVEAPAAQTVVPVVSAAPVAAIDPAKMTARDQEIMQANNAASIYAGPAVRRIAQEFGVNLTKVKGTGRKNRILKEDVQQYVKASLQKAEQGGSGAGLDLLPWPKVDFKKFGAVEVKPLNKIKRATARNLHRNWVMIPHVTQFDEVDITAMEEFRKAHKAQAEKQGYKLTPIVFIMKAVVAALQEYPMFNASLDDSGENLVFKQYYNLGVAVDTPNGLVVPVIKAVDTKSLSELAKEIAAASEKARTQGLSMQEMQGGNFSISSLGGIGGTAFTPIVNAPDVAILGVSKAQMKPIYINGKFEPRLMLPLSLSYDHRVIDGADGARFITFLSQQLSDIKNLAL